MEIANTRRQVQITDKRIAVVAAGAEEVFRQMHLTVVCIYCGGTPMCRNAVTDTNWKMECACTTRHLVNPDVKRITLGVN